MRCYYGCSSSRASSLEVLAHGLQVHQTVGFDRCRAQGELVIVRLQCTDEARAMLFLYYIPFVNFPLVESTFSLQF